MYELPGPTLLIPPPPPPPNDIMQYLTCIFVELGVLAGKMGNAIMMHFRNLVDNGM